MQCTEYCRERMLEVNGASFPSGMGNAKDWYNKSLPDPFRKIGRIKEKSVACFTGGPTGLGHVMFIESVVGNSCTFREANCSSPGDGEECSADSMSAYIKSHGSNMTFKGCIYVDLDENHEID